MKKHAIFALSILLFFTLITKAQIRFTKVDPVTDIITIHNYGSTTVNISNYQICRKFQYKVLSSLNLDSGSLMLQAGNDVVLSNTTLNMTSSDLGLYKDGNFTSTTSMRDFLQWGSAGNGRESVANAKGIWTTGNFISTTGPYFYSGNGTETGMSFWSNSTLAVADVLFSNQTFVYPNPVKNILNIKNTTNQKIIRAELFNILGNQIIVNNKIANSINMNALSSGIYYLRLTSDQGAVSHKKIIKD